METMIDFDNNAKIHFLLNEFILDIIYRYDNTEKLWDYKYLNSLDRKDLADQYIELFLDNYPEEVFNEKNEIDKKSLEQLKEYAEIEIDRLIPKIYFLESNKEISNRYTPLLTRRIFDTSGSKNLECTKNLKYLYPHTKEFRNIKRTIEESKATDKQIQYLNDLEKNIGYLLWNEEYLSKNYANQLIEYISEKSYIEPEIFSFFFVSK